MKHCIIVKWNETVTDKRAILPELEALFAKAADIPGVRGAKLVPNCVDRANRYDLAIAVDMDRDALPAWDESAVHHAWKDTYGARIAQKAIFDFEA